MELKVGQAIRFRNQMCVCTKLERIEQTELASEDSDKIFNEARTRIGNLIVVNQSVEPFKKHDIVTTTMNRITLEIPGQHMFIIEQNRITKREGTLDEKRNQEDTCQARN